MCIIIFDNRDTDETVPKDYFLRSQEKNQDGMGIMWAWKGQLHTYQTLKNFDGIWERYLSARRRKLPVGTHFRLATKGAVKALKNCHPFEIVPKQLSFMHNGTIEAIDKLLPDGTSDTSYINSELFQHLPGNFLKSPLHLQMLHDLLNGGRLLFMDDQGRHTIINNIKWGAQWKDGVWYSKDKHLKFITTGVDIHTTTYGTGYGHTFPEHDNEKDWYTGKKKQKMKKKGKKENNPLPFMKSGKQLSPLNNIIKALTRTAPKEPMSFGPEPSKHANLLFDYGFLERAGFVDNRIKEIGEGVVQDEQLWALGEVDNEQPAAIHTNGAAVQGKLFKVTKDFKKVFERLDTQYACDLKSPNASVYYRRYLTMRRIGGGEMKVWFYRYVAPIQSNASAAIVTFGDWSRWSGKNKHNTNLIRTVNVDKADFYATYKCPHCTSKSTIVVEAAHGKGFILYCEICEVESPIIEREMN